MDNYWYYTLSAIPQTLAAMIALAATFFVFRLNFISEEIRRNRKDLSRFILLLAPGSQGEIHIIEQKTEEEFLEFYEQALEQIKFNRPNLGFEKYEKLEKEMWRIISKDWNSYFKARPERIANYLYMKRDILKYMLSVKKMAKSLLGLTLLATTLMIILSLCILPNHDALCKPKLILGIVLFGALASVILTAYSVWRIATVRI